MIFILFFNFTNTASFHQCMLHYDLWLSSQTNDEKRAFLRVRSAHFYEKKQRLFFDKEGFLQH